MSDADKLAAIDTVLNDLLSYESYLTARGRFEQVEPAEANSLRKIAEIVGFSFPLYSAAGSSVPGSSGEGASQ